MNKIGKRANRPIALQQKKIDHYKRRLTTITNNKSTFIMIIMIAAVAENNALKTMICFGIYLMISKVQITYLWTPHYNGKKDI
jgi:hypothetical protein